MCETFSAWPNNGIFNELVKLDAVTLGPKGYRSIKHITTLAETFSRPSRASHCEQMVRGKMKDIDRLFPKIHFAHESECIWKYKLLAISLKVDTKGMLLQLVETNLKTLETDFFMKCA
jgi:hypothetical protein